MIQGRYVRGLVEAVGLLSLACVGMFILRVIVTGTLGYAFMPWNLLLAWIPLLLILVLKHNLKRRRWLAWQNVLVSLLWIVFLPNSWYVITDFSHVQTGGQITELYDTIFVATLAVCGSMLGFASLSLFHQQLLKRFSEKNSYRVVELVLLVSSFAIYLGRDLRWNTWDVVTDPTGLILDVSDRIVDPFGHPRAISVTAMFFVFLSLIYFIVYRGSKLLGSQPKF